MNGLGAGSQQEKREMERAEREPHQLLQSILPASLAANLEMEQVVVPRQIGGKEHPHVGRYAAHSVQGWAEQNDLSPGRGHGSDRACRELRRAHAAAASVPSERA
ncbi:MAG TPA: hypothetical protein VEM34_09765, partial [Burkholderiales bacterium]|nr:hypothetical protein [Burkholderiales bacterium]